MATTEHTINDALADVLRTTRHVWKESEAVRSENTGTIKGSNARPDILIVEPFVSPVIVETEFVPALTVESEAISRLGQQLSSSGRTVISTIAVRIPKRFKDYQGAKIKENFMSVIDLNIVLFTGSNPQEFTRWPSSGWIQGDVADLSILIQSSSVPPELINVAADQLVSGVTEAAGLLGELVQDYPGAIEKISLELCQEDGEQTRRMSSTILANAFMFHEILAGGQDELADVLSLEEIKGTSNKLTKSGVLEEWRKILNINYWPIFDIARRILEAIPSKLCGSLLDVFASTADKLLQTQLISSHDLTGAVFQKLIADRKFLAAYYTTPASAALLVGMAIKSDSLNGDKSWSNPDDVTSLRIADFACGTGTLLQTAYQRINQLHEISGGNSTVIHSTMMEKAIVGCVTCPCYIY